MCTVAIASPFIFSLIGPLHPLPNLQLLQSVLIHLSLGQDEANDAGGKSNHPAKRQSIFLTDRDKGRCFRVSTESHKRHFMNRDLQQFISVTDGRFTKHSQYSSWGSWPFFSVCIRGPRVPPAPLPSGRQCFVARPAAVSQRWSCKARRQRGRAAEHSDTQPGSA